MTPPEIREKPKTTVRPYVQANAGYTSGTGLDCGAEAGARLSSGNLEATAGVRQGTVFGVSADVKYTMPMGKKNDHVKLALFGHGDIARSNVSSNHMTSTVKENDNLYSYDDSWKRHGYNVGVGAGMQFSPLHDKEGNVSDKLKITAGFEVFGTGDLWKKRGMSTPYVSEYVSPSHFVCAAPVFNVQYNPNNHLSFDLNAKAQNVGVTARYTF